MSTKVLVVALPFAGGNSYCYNFLRPLLPANITLETLEYAGRGVMSDTMFIEDMDLLIEDLLNQYISIINIVRPHRVVFYGHSLGAIIGYELLHAISKKHTILAPQSAIFSGHGAPATTAKKSLASLPDAELIGYFTQIGAILPEIAVHTELMEYILPILRNDLMLYEDHNTIHTEKLSIPLMIINGKQDNILQKDIDSWSLETSNTTKFYFQEGHHFFISQYPQAFAHLMTNLITNGTS